MIDYFNLYKNVLRIIYEENINDDHELIKKMNNSEIILNELEKGTSGKLLAQATLEILENLMDDQLIKGKISKSKDGKIYTISHLTTIGHQYLAELKDPSVKEKAVEFLKENGLPMTPQSVSKALFNVTL